MPYISKRYPHGYGAAKPAPKGKKIPVEAIRMAAKRGKRRY